MRGKCLQLTALPTNRSVYGDKQIFRCDVSREKSTD